MTISRSISRGVPSIEELHQSTWHEFGVVVDDVGERLDIGHLDAAVSWSSVVAAPRGDDGVGLDSSSGAEHLRAGARLDRAARAGDLDDDAMLSRHSWYTFGASLFTERAPSSVMT